MASLRHLPKKRNNFNILHIKKKCHMHCMSNNGLYNLYQLCAMLCVTRMENKLYIINTKSNAAINNPNHPPILPYILESDKHIC